MSDDANKPMRDSAFAKLRCVSLLEQAALIMMYSSKTMTAESMRGHILDLAGAAFDKMHADYSATVRRFGGTAEPQENAQPGASGEALEARAFELCADFVNHVPGRVCTVCMKRT